MVASKFVSMVLGSMTPSERKTWQEDVDALKKVGFRLEEARCIACLAQKDRNRADRGASPKALVLTERAHNEIYMGGV